MGLRYYSLLASLPVCIFSHCFSLPYSVSVLGYCYSGVSGSPEATGRQPSCRHAYGHIIDRATRKNVTICREETNTTNRARALQADRKRHVYTSTGNQVQIVLDSTVADSRFLIHIDGTVSEYGILYRLPWQGDKWATGLCCVARKVKLRLRMT